MDIGRSSRSTDTLILLFLEFVINNRGRKNPGQKFDSMTTHLKIRLDYTFRWKVEVWDLSAYN